MWMAWLQSVEVVVMPIPPDLIHDPSTTITCLFVAELRLVLILGVFYPCGFLTCRHSVVLEIFIGTDMEPNCTVLMF